MFGKRKSLDRADFIDRLVHSTLGQWLAQSNAKNNELSRTDFFREAVTSGGNEAVLAFKKTELAYMAGFAVNAIEATRDVEFRDEYISQIVNKAAEGLGYQGSENELYEYISKIVDDVVDEFRMIEREGPHADQARKAIAHNFAHEAFGITLDEYDSDFRHLLKHTTMIQRLLVVTSQKSYRKARK